MYKGQARRNFWKNKGQGLALSDTRDRKSAHGKDSSCRQIGCKKGQIQWKSLQKSKGHIISVHMLYSYYPKVWPIIQSQYFLHIAAGVFAAEIVLPRNAGSAVHLRPLRRFPQGGQGARGVQAGRHAGDGHGAAQGTLKVESSSSASTK